MRVGRLTLPGLPPFFATVRPRTDKTRGCGIRLATLAMVFKLAKEAEKTWKKIKGHSLIPSVLKERSSLTAKRKTIGSR